MKNSNKWFVVFSALMAMTFVFAGCGDPLQKYIRQVDAKPPSERPPNWEQTKRRMLRPAPQVGQPAPDFTLTALDGTGQITRSKFHPDRPLVLVFGSFT